MSTKELFVSNLRRLRKAKFKSQGAFASLVGLSERGYQSYEQGVTDPIPEVIDRFAKVLGCDPLDLLAPPPKDNTRNREARNPGIGSTARLLAALDRDHLLRGVVFALVLDDDAYIDELDIGAVRQLLEARF